MTCDYKRCDFTRLGDVHIDVARREKHSLVFRGFLLTGQGSEGVE